MSWASRADNIRQRDWSDLLPFWAEFGTGFDTAHFRHSSLELLVHEKTTPAALTGNNIHIIKFDDRAPFASDLVFSQIKANQALVCASQRITSGNVTWGVTDAYHASMLLMRSILAALGIFVCRVHNRNVLIDAFPWCGRIDDQKRFKKRFEDWRQCAAVISCTSRNFEQVDLYMLFQRALRISTVPATVWPEIVVRNILATDKAHFSHSRNQIIYGSRFWFNLDDLLGECVSLQWKIAARRNIVSYAFAKTDTATEIDCYCDSWVLYLMSLRLHEAIYRQLVDSIDVFSFVVDRRANLALVEQQFNGQF